MVQVAEGVAFARRRGVGNVGGAFIDDFATQSTGIGTDVDEVVGSTHDVLVVFYDDHRIADVAQFFQDFYQTAGIARVQPDAGFV